MQASSPVTNGHVTVAAPAPLGLTPAAARRGRSRRANVRLLAGAICVVAAFVGFLVFVASVSPRTQGVVVASHGLAAGTRLRRSDLAVAQAQLGSAQAQTVVLADGLDGLEGRQLLAPVAAQQVLVKAELAPPTRPLLEPGQVRMTLPVKPETAVGGALRSGDVVTVLATRDKGKPTADTRAVLERAVVDEVGFSGTLGGGTAASNPSQPGPPISTAGRTIAWVTLVVPEDKAATLSLARWNGDIELIQLPASSAAAASAN
jgi:Flp pilus assembly protein CpaB